MLPSTTPPLHRLQQLLLASITCLNNKTFTGTAVAIAPCSLPCPSRNPPKQRQWVLLFATHKTSPAPAVPYPTHHRHCSFYSGDGVCRSSPTHTTTAAADAAAPDQPKSHQHSGCSPCSLPCTKPPLQQLQPLLPAINKCKIAAGVAAVAAASRPTQHHHCSGHSCCPPPY
jgi:hypothetical protein